MCIRNWPLPIGAFQDQCKLIVINEHNLGKNPNWREADQLAIWVLMGLWVQFFHAVSHCPLEIHCSVSNSVAYISIFS